MLCSLLGADKPASLSSPGLAASRPQARNAPSKDPRRSSIADDYGAQELWQTNSRAGSGQQLDAGSDLDDAEDTRLTSSRAGLGSGSQAGGMSAAQRSARPGQQGSARPDVTANSFRFEDEPSSSGLTSAGRAAPVSPAPGLAGQGSTMSTGSSGPGRPGSISSQSSAYFLAAPSPPFSSSRGSGAASTTGLADQAAFQPVKSLDNTRMNPATSAIGDRRSELDSSDRSGRPGAGSSQTSPGQTSRTSGMSDSHLSLASDPRFPMGKLAADEDDAPAGRPGLGSSLFGSSSSNQGQSARSPVTGINVAGSTPSQRSPAFVSSSPVGPAIKQSPMLSRLQDSKAAQKQSLSTDTSELPTAQTSRSTLPRSGAGSSDVQQPLGKLGSNLDTPRKQLVPAAQAYSAKDSASKSVDAGGVASSGLQQQSSSKPASKSFQEGRPTLTAGTSAKPASDLVTDSDASGSLRGTALQRQASMNASPEAKLSAQQALRTPSRTYPALDLAADRDQPSSRGSQDALPALRSYPDVNLRDDLEQSDDHVASHLDQVLKSASKHDRMQSQAQPVARTYPSMSMMSDADEADDSFSATLQQPLSKPASGSQADRTSTGQLASLSSRGMPANADQIDSLLSSVLNQGQNTRQSPSKQKQPAGRLQPSDQKSSASDISRAATAGLPRERSYPEMQLTQSKQAGASGLRASPAMTSQKGSKSARQQGVPDNTLDDEADELRSLPSAPFSHQQGKSSRQESLAAEGLTPLAQRLSQTPGTDAALEYDAEDSKPAKTSLLGQNGLSSSSKQSQKAMSAAPLRPSIADDPDDLDNDLGSQIPSKTRYDMAVPSFALGLCRVQ